MSVVFRKKNLTPLAQKFVTQAIGSTTILEILRERMLQKIKYHFRLPKSDQLVTSETEI